ncbi:hypothetical protein HDC90_001118 [Pedobacter sp. AK013]|uniref:hypothetical protein n=1 Tax=Pedobacter sp. AK013 TaxID=2723071 RepID=UPI00161729D3|nr:hypothetical protein [Pedobacter sp. AK013]MBB6236506.1 hypothetical protein [Pedobacter sp. AK013]
MIKQKVGKCVDCPDGSIDRPLIAKRCTNGPHYHYQNHNSKRYAAKSSTNNKKKEDRVKLLNDGLSPAVWFQQQIALLPQYCENCEQPLIAWAKWNLGAFIAHIIPKRDFESVIVHPLNRLFLCIDCHTNYDRATSAEIKEMKCWPVALARFNHFKKQINPEEISALQDCFFENLSQ